jgi:tetratricopeptide (TPR) repeat protein
MLLSRFREQLRSSEWAERERVPLAAGFAILCVIAKRFDPAVQPDTSDVDMARAAIETLPPSAASRALAALLRVIDEDPPAPAGPELMAYGKALEEDGAYEFAADVYQLAAELGRREQGLLLVPAALNRVGACLRSISRFREATRAYRAAAALAQEIGDLIEEMLSRIGLAKITMAQDKYAAARAQFDRIIQTAREKELWYPLALALHDRGTLANKERELEGALIYLGEALSLQRDRAPQMRVLSDIAWTLRELGFLDIAHDVLCCVRAESPQLEIRWNATINLLEVAADQRQWAEFDRLRLAIEATILTPHRHCEFLVTLAEGLTLRGEHTWAQETYETLRDIARHHELPEFERLALRALDGDHVGRTAPPPARPLPVRCRPAIDVIRQRVTASAGSN